MPQHAANQAADDGAWNVGLVLLNDLLLLDPAALLRRADDGAHGHDISLVELLP